MSHLHSLPPTVEAIERVIAEVSALTHCCSTLGYDTASTWRRSSPRPRPAREHQATSSPHIRHHLARRPKTARHVQGDELEDREPVLHVQGGAIVPPLDDVELFAAEGPARPGHPARVHARRHWWRFQTTQAAELKKRLPAGDPRGLADPRGPPSGAAVGWSEIETRVMWDAGEHLITVLVRDTGTLDPMGVDTGDSVTVAPQQTLPDRLYQKLRDQAIAVIRAVGVETGGSNVQFAVNPATEEVVVIEMNPRVSRSSALASKATGFPIAKIAAQARRRLRARGDRQRHHAADARVRSSRRSTTSSSSGRGSPSRSSPAPTRASRPT